MIRLYTSFVAPSFFRIIHGRDKLIPGPSRSYSCWCHSVAWVSFIIMVMLFYPPGQKPTAQEITSSHIILGKLIQGKSLCQITLFKTTQWLSPLAFFRIIEVGIPLVASRPISFARADRNLMCITQEMRLPLTFAVKACPRTCGPAFKSEAQPQGFQFIL